MAGLVAGEMEHRNVSQLMSSRDLCFEIVPIDAAGAALRDQLFALMLGCYDCMTRERFEADLAEKDCLIVLRDTTGTPRGFSTQQISLRDWEGRKIQVLFSGDTIIEPAYWGSPELVKGWCAVAAHAISREPDRALYWFLISKGYRTYLYLPLFFREFYPQRDGEANGDFQHLLHALATEKFGDAYDMATCVARFPESFGQLAPELADVPVSRRDDPDVRFFLDRNPGYACGDELACLAEVSLENMHGMAHRWLKRALQNYIPHV